MSKKAIVHGVILAALVIYTIIAWNSVKREEQEAKEARKEAAANGETDHWADVKMGQNRQKTAEGMIKVGIPLLVSVIYAGVLAVLYLLPALVDKVGEEMMGSTAMVDDDPLDEARAAVAAGEFPDAIAVYRKYWLANPGERHALTEMAKIQRVYLESPAVAVSTLEEGLDEYDWSQDDAAFLMFRIAEIYEEDLNDQEQVIAVMKRAVEELEGTRHGGNAVQKLRELGVT